VDPAVCVWILRSFSIPCCLQPRGVDPVRPRARHPEPNLLAQLLHFWKRKGINETPSQSGIAGISLSPCGNSTESQFDKPILAGPATKPSLSKPTGRRDPSGAYPSHYPSVEIRSCMYKSISPDPKCVSLSSGCSVRESRLGVGIWSVLLQHGFCKRSTEQKLIYAKASDEIALGANF
jgi:hypothetical protein